ncbi:MAG: UbiA family prenyltransferase [Methanoregula sp.]|nr:MAG: UbiA family prenyltransferase [Methanoregula sp.]
MALPASVVVVPEDNEFFWLIGRAWNRITNLYDLLVFSSLLLSLECISMAYISCFIQQVPWNSLCAIIPFLVAFSIYNLNRKTDEEEDAINRQDRFAFTKRYETHLYYGAIISLAIALALSATYGIPSLLATAAPFICGFLYSFRWLPRRIGYRRLKEIPAVKNIIVGFAWAIILSLLPVFLNHGTPDSRTAIIFLLFFMWGFMASLIPDIRDRAGDASAGVRTIPVIFGEERAKTLLSNVLLLLGVPLVLFSLLFLPPFTTILLLAANLYSHGCVHLLGRTRIRDFVADAISDGQYICFALALFVITTLWPGL